MRYHNEHKKTTLKERPVAKDERPVGVSLVACESLAISLTRNILHHKATPTAIDTGTTPSMEQISNLTLIEKRLDNWFVKQSQASVNFTGNVQKRWNSLQGDVNDALTKFASLNVVNNTDGIIKGKI